MLYNTYCTVKYIFVKLKDNTRIYNTNKKNNQSQSRRTSTFSRGTKKPYLFYNNFRNVCKKKLCIDGSYHQ